MSEKYNWRQKMLSLIWLTYCLSIPKTYFGDQEFLQDFATRAVKANFADPEVRDLIGMWELVWGCAIYQKVTKTMSSNVNDHTMYMAKYKGDPDCDRYVIALAGTNPFSLQNILVEDINVSRTSGWNNGQPWLSTEHFAEDPGKPAVSNGIAAALKELTTDMWDGDKRILDYLQEITAKATKPIEITVAGHSLAGAMAPSLGLSLVDRQAEWDPSKTATIKVVTLAGFTPGNAAFAEYYDATLGENTDRLWNQIDVVPNVFEVEGLRKVAGIYSPSLWPSVSMTAVFKGLEVASGAQNYTHILRSTPGIPSEFNPAFTIGNLDGDPDLKGVVLDMCAEMVAYPALQEVQMIPLVPDSIKDKLKVLVKEFGAEVREVLDELVTVGGDVEDVITERLGDVLSQATGLPPSILMFNAPPGLKKVLATEQLVNLINYVLQLLYHHVWRYAEYFEFTELDKRRQEITVRVAGEMKKKQAEVQPENTVIVNYGSAKKDDVDDLLNGEGKLLAGISGIMKNLKEAGQVSQSAQPVIFLVKKKKSDDGF
ncbi:lipase family protein [Roseofilum casamattae]|uniref:Fungal lipase-type domain-containing protein n=1 Tax=Roseofilum casamattae BLCC-M143 TaxID=3022442 RepID=A0ABT7BWJ9_9CYAN|nr:hypothetical protein [Roseofilum casamattae]MDJ1183558.1 hypothetical protein [Roseofilum casamattae BLCC-M143]